MDLRPFLDPLVAHRVLFEHRHPEDSPRFHHQMISHMHSLDEEKRDQLYMAFRGAGKSTIAEEVIILQAAMPALLARLGRKKSPIPTFKNCVIIGSSYEKAVERLLSIRMEFETNELMQVVFGDMVSSPWGESKIVLSTGSSIQARGKEQSMRGLKHLTWRPDLFIFDDYEDEEDIDTKLARDKVWSKFMKGVLPALDPSGRMIMLATPLHPESIPMRLKSREQGQWFSRTYPIEILEKVTGERKALWPSRFPLDKIDKLRGIYQRTGSILEWEQEYMCRAEIDEDKSFREEYFKEERRERTYEGVWIMVDPARTVGAKSASTALVAFSWVGSRLIVWESRIGMYMPDEIIDHIADMDRIYNPIAIGFEEDGLNQWGLQPLRRKMAELGRVIPIRPMRAPRAKLDFIKSLQPYFKAGEVSFSPGSDMTELKNQFLGFPRGKIDGPNALAYATRMRSGPPIYEDFTDDHVSPVKLRTSRAVHLAISSEGPTLTAAACQMIDGEISILWDQLYEGSIAECLARCLRDAAMEVGGRQRAATPPPTRRGESSDIMEAAQRLRINIEFSGNPAVGREEMRRLLRERVKGLPCVTVSPEARWTANALAGGYARSADLIGSGTESAVKGVHATLMNGIESLLAMTVTARQNDSGDESGNLSYTSDGRTYRSALRSRA